MSDEGERIQSLDDIAERQSRLEAKLDQLLGGVHEKAEKHTEKRLDRPTEIQEMVRMELERKDREAKEAADKDSEKSERQTIREQLAKLTEAKPVAPQPRRQRIMWGKR